MPIILVRNVKFPCALVFLQLCQTCALEMENAPKQIFAIVIPVIMEPIVNCMTALRCHFHHHLFAHPTVSAARLKIVNAAMDLQVPIAKFPFASPYLQHLHTYATI